MRSLVVSVFNSGEVVPVYNTLVDDHCVMIQVCDTDDLRGPEYYDYRFSAPVQEHCLEEVEQLMYDLLRYAVANVGGLQPTLFA